ncbi:DUF6916 family protein [Trinickia acidisoli]|uniref:DUF6916 family protein n=1 Tax=Trinickia acidisoli TaxID=2767482 RepID=UPI001A8D6B78|nr:hypothetical protein [Trinickia acidisoli]
MTIPTRTQLTASLGHTFMFSGAGDWAVAAKLTDVRDGIPMDENYVCYSAIFEMPADVNLPQNVYRIASSTGDAWELLVTPYRPTAEGKPVMGAVFHCLASTVE